MDSHSHQGTDGLLNEREQIEERKEKHRINKSEHAPDAVQVTVYVTAQCDISSPQPDEY